MSSISSSGSTILCARCGYDLRGTVIGAGCPECGLAVNASVHGIRAEGKYLVVQDDAVLPKRCLITNEEIDDEPVKKTLYWSHPALYLLILLNLLVFLIVALIVRKKCRIAYYISEEQKSKRNRRVTIAVITSLSSFIFAIAMVVYERWAEMWVGFLVFLVALICAVVFSNTLRIAKVKGRDFWIKGAGPEFLRSIEFGV